MCGHCFAAMTDVVHVLFFNCRWTYTGQLLNGERRQSEREERTNSYEYFPQEKQELPWKWLKFTVSEEEGGRKSVTQGTQTSSDSPPTHAATQTDTDLSHVPSDSKVINEGVVDALIASEKRYRDKYKALKHAFGVKKSKCL